MSGKSHYGMAEAHENVVAIRLDGQALDFAVEALGEGAQMVEQVLADFALVGRYRFDVDKGPGELKYVHKVALRFLSIALRNTRKTVTAPSAPPQCKRVLSALAARIRALCAHRKLRRERLGTTLKSLE